MKARSTLAILVARVLTTEIPEPSLVLAFHVGEFPLLISSVLLGLFFWYSSFPLSLKTTHITHSVSHVGSFRHTMCTYR